MTSLLQDLRYALRSFARNPGFNGIAIFTIALGIGATTAIFSLVNGMLLEPLPFDEGDRLVEVGHWYPELELEASVSASGYTDYREQDQVFESTAMRGWWGANVTGDMEPARFEGARVTASYLSTLGIQPVLGRGFLAEEEEPGRDRVLMLGYHVWQERFGGDPGVLDDQLRVNGEAYQVVGVMPPLPAPFRTDIWMPLAFTPQQLSGGRTNEAYQMVAKLRPGITVEQAESHMADLATRLREQGGYPDMWAGFWVTPLAEQVIGSVRTPLLILMAAVTLVLLIACANVANLLLARASTRRREIAVRATLGAGRGRIARQMLTESVLLAVLGGILGIGMAVLGIEALAALDPGNLPRLQDISLDGRVLLFALGLSLLTGLLFGVLPALQTARAQPQEVLRQEAGRGSSAFGHRGVRRLVVVAEIALALVLLTGSALLIRSVARLQQIDPGFDGDDVITMQVTLPEAKYDSNERQIAFFQELTRELLAVPGVVTAGAVSVPPLVGSGNTRSFEVETYVVPEGERSPWGEFRIATPGYFEAMGIPLLRGRYFSESDHPESTQVAVVDEQLAQQYWPGEDALGKRVSIGSDAEGNRVWAEVVGVVGHVLSQGIEVEPRTQLYVPYAQFSPGNSMVVSVRAGMDPAALVAPLRSAVLRVDPEMPVYDVKPMTERFAASFAQQRFLMVLLTAFAVIAVILAAVGIYGVMSYAVAQRTREVGIRMALGAHRRAVLALVVKQGMTVAAVGIALGVLGALASGRLIASQLYDVRAMDPGVLTVVVLLFAALALVATYLPARRATRVDPMIALRAE